MGEASLASGVRSASRAQLYGHGAVTVWLTGLPASGKSTIASTLEGELFRRGVHCCVLDGDEVRRGLNSDLGFSAEDRNENIRRIGEVARLFVGAGLIGIVAFISPYRRERDRARERHAPGQFIEVHVKCPLAVCEARDPKGNYRKARAGKLPEFTGVDAPYEEPLHPEIVLETDRMSVAESVQSVITYLTANGFLGRGERAERPADQGFA